jgi:hypothetical protein
MIKLIVREPWPSTKAKPMYQCTLEEYDLGVPIGSGATIQEAIDDFLESYIPDKDSVQVCPQCGAPTEERQVGDEGFTFCSEGCGCLEGETPLYVLPDVEYTWRGVA